MSKFCTFLLCSTLVLGSCGPYIYKSPGFDSALARHRTVAILPATVIVTLRHAEAKKFSSEELLDMERQTGYDIQDRMYSWFLGSSEKYNYTVSFQDVSRTNALLLQEGIDYRNLATTDCSELAKLLGVDAVIQDRTLMDKPLSTGAASVGIFFGLRGTTNRVVTTINIKDGKSGILLWKYAYDAMGTLGSSIDNLVDALLSNASKKFPYKTNKPGIAA